MRRKKRGYILLALLVITGFAGTISGSISGKERRIALNLMKSSKADVLLSLKGLNTKQLDFKIARNKWSARECLYHIAVSENELWDWLQTALNSPANPEKRFEVKLTDEQLIQAMEDRNYKMETDILPEYKNASYKSFNDALNDFKKKRGEHIEYLKSTTEDLRDHIIETPIGWVDCYQLCLVIASHSNRHMQQINETKEKLSRDKAK